MTMKTTAKEFRKNPNKAITLLGMSGVGKTTFSSRLPLQTWFHYSGDYRIGTKYLDEPILDHIKSKAMEHDYLRGLLCQDLIYIRNNITLDHLQPIAHFLGKIGNSELGGLSVEEFKRRQALFYQAEIEAMQDVAEFMRKSQSIYNYPHFINDAGGSICYLSDDECWNKLGSETVVLYLQASDDMEQTLIERAKKKPKPLFYQDEFLDIQVASYLEQNDMGCANDINPDEFVTWVFPALIKHRKPLYESITHQHGHTVEAEKIFHTRDEKDIIDLICDSIDKNN